MSTRGVWGFRKNGHTVVTYRHFDCYPENLGTEFYKFLKKNNFGNRIEELFDRIVEVDTSKKPTDEQKQYCKDMGWFDESVSSRNDDDWYCLLRVLQDPESWQNAIDKEKKVFVENYIDFLIHDSLFCEYGYIFDIDNQELEFYVGFQKSPQEDNPYGCKPNEGGYYPCCLAGKLPMDNVDLLKYLEPDEVSGWMKVLAMICEK